MKNNTVKSLHPMYLDGNNLNHILMMMRKYASSMELSVQSVDPDQFAIWMHDKGYIWMEESAQLIMDALELEYNTMTAEC